MYIASGKNGITWSPAAWWSRENRGNTGPVIWTGSSGDGRLTVAMEKPKARAGERWNEIMVHIDSTEAAEPHARLRARLYAIGGSEPLEEAAIDAASPTLLVKVDLRRYSLHEARLSLTFLEDSAEVFLAAEAPKIAVDDSTRIPIHQIVPKISPNSHRNSLTNILREVLRRV